MELRIIIIIIVDPSRMVTTLDHCRSFRIF